ncbi:MAG: hypothetical protein ACI4DU_09325 [Lachnospiraceae bacterium]
MGKQKMGKQRKFVSAILMVLGLLLTACGNTQATSANETVSHPQPEVTVSENAETVSEDVAEEIPMPENCVTVVYVTINPQLALYLDQEQVIQEVEYLNEDAEVFSELNLAGQSIEQGIEDIVETAIEKEFLTDENEVHIEVAGDTDNINAEMLSQHVEEVIMATPVTCKDCGGTGIVCSECGGTGIVDCKACNQTGYETCPTCGGSATINCHGCQGSGVDATSGEACRHCGGSGRITCDACNGSPSYLCTHCHGTLQHVCPVCNGIANCTTCGGTGVVER